MSVPVLTAVGDPEWEAGLVGTLGRADLGVHVVRRCVDLADLLAAAAAGLARAVLLAPDLRRLDRDALVRLAAAGVAVVGLAAPGDDAERRLRQLGVAHVLPADAPASAIAAAVIEAVTAGVRPVDHALADPAAALPPPPRVAAEAGVPYADDVAAPGRIVAVWGPTGAPGRSSVAVGVAAELAESGVETLLVDADVYGGAVAQLLGLLDESPGLAGACRAANAGTWDIDALANLALRLRPRLRVLTGIARADRWPELRPSALDDVLALCRHAAEVTVVDCGFCLERDEELSFDTVAPRRNGATLTVLEAADRVLAVASADPLGLQRFVRGLTDLADVAPTATPTAVVNRVRAAAIGGGDPHTEIAAALQRFAGQSDLRFIPNDPAAFDVATATGRTLPEAAPKSPARAALRQLAAEIAGLPTPTRRRRLLRPRSKVSR